MPRTSSRAPCPACSSFWGSKIVPQLTKFVRKVIEWKPQVVAFFMGVKDAAAPFFAAFKTGVGVIFPIIQKFFQFIFSNKPLLIAAIAAVGIAIALALGPAGLAVAAIIGIIAIIGLVKKNWETIWAAVANFFIGVVNQIIEGINTVTGIFSKLPGVADMEIKKFEKIVVRGAETTDELTKAAEEVTPAVTDVGAAAQTVTPQVNGLTTATEDLGEAVLTTAERVRDWKKAQEEAGRAGSDMESQYRGQVIPTLSDLIAKQEEEVEAQRKVETAWKDLGVVTDEISRQIESDELRKTRAADAHVLALDTAAEAQRMAHEKAGKAATDAATEIEAAAIKAATAAQRATDRMINSWNTYLVNQNEVVAAMRANSISFEDVVDALAKSFGLTTTQMAAHLQLLGVSYGDTMALMEAVGQEKIAAIIAQIQAAAAAAAAAKRVIESIGSIVVGGGVGAGSGSGGGGGGQYALPGGGTTNTKPPPAGSPPEDFEDWVNRAIPAAAKGANVLRGGAVKVGERGPELVNLPRGAQVSPLDGSGGGVTINFNGPIYGVDDFDEAVNKARLRFRRAGN